MPRGKIKLLSLIIVMVLAFSNVVLAAEVEETEEYPDVMEFFYETGESIVIKASQYMTTSRGIGNENLISPPYNLSGGSSRDYIGGDNRNPANATIDPYQKVICLNIGQDTNGDGIADSYGVGTGFMVDDDVMLTAAHCFHDKYNGLGQAEEVQIILKQQGDTLKTTYYHPYSWTISSDYLNASGYTRINDWCVVKINTPIGNQTGWFGYGVAFGTKDIYVSGYPDEDGFQYYQFYAEGTFYVHLTTQFLHTCDTRGGQSGAPAYDSDYIAWGIHTGGENDSYNIGCRITAQLKSLIDSKK